MYLTGGQFKGRKIDAPKDVRPTLSKVRSSVFNILAQYCLKDNEFLDMFAGSAIMGLEALSRGYSVKELEINPKIAKIIKNNYEKLAKKPDITICDSLKYETGKKYDVIYIDPPWDYDYKNIIKKAGELLNMDGIIVIEYDELKKIDINNIIYDKLKIIKEKKYGRTRLCFLSFEGAKKF